MWPLPLGELFTVGGSTAEKLRKAKINTIGDLVRTDLENVQKIVGMKMGKRISDYCLGSPSRIDKPLLNPEEILTGERLLLSETQLQAPNPNGTIK